MAPPQHSGRLRLPRPDAQPRAPAGRRARRAAQGPSPIHWVDVPGGTGGFGDKGYWLVTKHADVKEVSRRSDVFSQLAERRHPGLAAGDDARSDRPAAAVMLNMDAPHHTRLRKIISRGFTPRAVGRLEDELAQRAQNIAKTAAAEGSGDFVEQVSCELPLQAIAGLLGVPQDDRDKLFRWSNEMTGGEDPEYADVDPAMSSVELIMYAMKMAEERGKNPDRRHRHAADRGRHRRREALRRRVRLLRGHARRGRQRDHAQLDHPRHDRVLAATPISGSSTRRSARRPPPTRSSAGPRRCRRSSAPRSRTPSWRGVQIKKGQRVVMSYRSANFDEEVFDDPHTLQHPAQPEPARRVRRHRRALLHRRQPGPDDHQPDLQRGRRPHARSQADR